jgi:hypothetical protein
MKKIGFIVGVVLLSGSLTLSAASLASWSIAGVQNGFEGNPAWNCTTCAAGIDPVKTVLKLDETKFSKAYFPAKSFTYRHLNDTALNPERYIQVIVTPTSGKTMNLTELSFNIYSTANGPLQVAVRSSLDQFGTSVKTADLTQGANTRVKVDMARLGLAGIKAPVEFRIYLWGATGVQTGYLTDDRSGPAVQLSGVILP